MEKNKFIRILMILLLIAGCNKNEDTQNGDGSNVSEKYPGFSTSKEPVTGTIFHWPAGLDVDIKNYNILECLDEGTKAKRNVGCGDELVIFCINFHNTTNNPRSTSKYPEAWYGYLKAWTIKTASS